MSKAHVLVVYKESTYARYGSSEIIVRGFKKNNYWKVLRKSHERHVATLEKVKTALKSRGFQVTTLLRSKVAKTKDVDRKFKLVVSVGGDGTFLECSHYLWHTPILGVNSDPEQSVARLSGSQGENFEKILDAYLFGRLKPASVWRLDFWVDGQRNRIPVLNDLLISTANPAGTSRYIIRVGRKSEEQMSSGIWVGSSAGSSAAVLSAGGKSFPATAKKFQFVSREVYHKKFGQRYFLKHVLGPSQTLEVDSYMRQGRIFVDGANLVVPFKVGDRLKVKLSLKPLKVIGLKA